MKKWMKRLVISLLVLGLVFCGSLIADKQRLRNDLIRLHVVANSNSKTDQTLKLQVRDAVVTVMEREMEGLQDVDEAKAYIRENLPRLRQVARQTLRDLGCSDNVKISFTRESFPLREYETFTLPSGIYESLRIVIGEGAGENWWCVVFPSLCYSSGEAFEDTAASAGFPDSLGGALSKEEGHEIRFFFLECLGKLENLIFGS